MKHLVSLPAGFLERFKYNCSQQRCGVRPLAESVEPEARRYNGSSSEFLPLNLYETLI